MQERRTRLSSVVGIKMFVRAAENCPFEIGVCYNHVCVDGKSFPGLMGVDLNQILRVRYGSESENTEFKEVLTEFAAQTHDAAQARKRGETQVPPLSSLACALYVVWWTQK